MREGHYNNSMVRPLCVAPNPVLRTPSAPIAEFNKELRQLIRDMMETMYANDGIGLAAPQIGRNVQVFIANPSQARGSELVVINPSIERTVGRAMIREGCLSVPDVWAKVRRFAQITLHGYDAQGHQHAITAQGLLAIVVQHECDHLLGTLFIDRISWWRKRGLKIPRHMTTR